MYRRDLTTPENTMPRLTLLVHSGFILSFVIASCLFAVATKATAASDWQWSIPVKGGVDKNGPSRAFLWIPPKCQRLRGVVLAQHNMEESSILETPKFRSAMAALDFGEIWCAPPFDHLFRFTEGAGDTFNAIMEALAKESGYDELKYVPIVGMGHSAAASWPYYFAAWNPERTLAALSVSGQWPYFRDKQFAPDIWGDRNIDFIPCLETMGEYESADTWSNEGLKERAAHPLMPLSMLACPAEGHFAATDKKAEFLAFYIKKAVQYRMGDAVPTGGPPKLKPIDPTKTGWLAERWRLNKEPTVPPAPVDQYKGDPKSAFWFFDEETVRAMEKYQAAYRGLKPQLVGYVQDGQVVPQKNNHLQVNLKFLPQNDGLTFKLSGSFYDTVPEGSPRPANWSKLAAGSPIGHASGGGPISIDRIGGPFERLAPDLFALRFDRTGMGDGKRPFELVFAATHPGDDEYKPAVQQAQMTIPDRNTAGRQQHISFPKIPDQPLGTEAVDLAAVSDSGETVYYYVLSGPAEVEENVLRIAPVPPRSRFPVKITVVAWQYGHSAEPKLKTADPVERSFYITK
jgi:hypothetical protein